MRSPSIRFNRAVRLLSLTVVLALALVGLQGCRPTCGSAHASPSDGGQVRADGPRGPDQRPVPKGKNKHCPPKGKSDKQSKMRGANGTQVTSKTLAHGTVSGYKWRIDVENPAPGKRLGSLHVQLGGQGSKHYEHTKSGKFVARDGTPLPRTVQRSIDRDPKAQAGIREGLKILGGR